MEFKNFADIETEFIERVHSIVWCAAATVDTKGRPRTRVLHPIWEGNVGWIGTHRSSHKSKHLEQNPHMSLAYIKDIFKPVYVECTAEWIDDLAQKERIWNLFKDAPPPLGYDPKDTFISYDHENFGVLKLTPWRIDIVNFPSPSFEEGTKIWRPGTGGE
jgi:general stress protein 26